MRFIKVFIFLLVVSPSLSLALLPEVEIYGKPESYYNDPVNIYREIGTTKYVYHEDGSNGLVSVYTSPDGSVKYYIAPGSFSVLSDFSDGLSKTLSIYEPVGGSSQMTGSETFYNSTFVPSDNGLLFDVAVVGGAALSFLAIGFAFRKIKDLI